MESMWTSQGQLSMLVWIGFSPEALVIRPLWWLVSNFSVKIRIEPSWCRLENQRSTHSVKIGPSGPWISVGAFDYYIRTDKKLETNLLGFGFDDPSTSIGQCKSAGISLKVKPSAPLSKPFIGFHNITFKGIYLLIGSNQIYQNFRKMWKLFLKRWFFSFWWKNGETGFWSRP